MGPLLGDFKFAPLTPELMAMQSELETLGGGDTRVGSLCVCCRIGPAQQHAAAGIIAAGNGVVSVRDPRGPQDLPADQSVRRYKLQPCLPASARGEELFAAVGEEALQWLWDGFNATILAYGQAGTGKTHTLFGSSSASAQHDLPLVPRLLSALCERAQRSSGSQRVGLACWEVLQNEAINLLPTPTEAHAAQRSQASANPSAFDSVEVASAAEAHAALLQAQTRSCNWGSDAASSLTALPNRAHTFVRITLYDAQQQRVSTLHIVDLVGSQSLSQSQGVVGSSLEAPDTLSQRQRERRVVNQQLLGLTRIISELAQKPALTGSTSRLLSARESKLTQILAPLLAGNSRTFMLATLSPDPANYLDTINTLRVATRAQAIKTACMTTRGVPPETVKMLPIWRVLSVEALNSSQGGPQLLPGHRQVEGFKQQALTSPIKRSSWPLAAQPASPAGSAGLLGPSARSSYESLPWGVANGHPNSSVCSMGRCSVPSSPYVGVPNGVQKSRVPQQRQPLSQRQVHEHGPELRQPQQWLPQMRTSSPSVWQASAEAAMQVPIKLPENSDPSWEAVLAKAAGPNRNGNGSLDERYMPNLETSLRKYARDMATSRHPDLQSPAESSARQQPLMFESSFAFAPRHPANSSAAAAASQPARSSEHSSRQLYEAGGANRGQASEACQGYRQSPQRQQPGGGYSDIHGPGAVQQAIMASSAWNGDAQHGQQANHADSMWDAHAQHDADPGQLRSSASRQPSGAGAPFTLEQLAAASFSAGIHSSSANESAPHAQLRWGRAAHDDTTPQSTYRALSAPTQAPAPGTDAALDPLANHGDYASASSTPRGGLAVHEEALADRREHGSPLQESLADHLRTLKKEFRNLYSSVLPETGRQAEQEDPSGASTSAQCMPSHPEYSGQQGASGYARQEMQSNAAYADPHSAPHSQHQQQQQGQHEHHMQAQQQPAQREQQWQRHSTSQPASTGRHPQPAETGASSPASFGQLWPQQQPERAQQQAEGGITHRRPPGHTGQNLAAVQRQQQQQQPWQPITRAVAPEDAAQPAHHASDSAPVRPDSGTNRQLVFSEHANQLSQQLVDPDEHGQRPETCQTAAGASPAALQALHRELEELRTQNVTILTMMEREKRTSESLRARAKEMEAEHLEACAQYEVRIQEDRMAALNLRSKCRKLESETLFASVFEKYEQEITQLQTEVGRLKEENSDLAKQAAAAEPKPLPGKLGRASEAADVSKALADPTSAEGRLVALRRKLKKTEGERDALRNEVLDLKKRDRLSELYHKKAEDGIKRVNELQRKLHAREAELEQRTLACTELAERSDAMQAQLQRVQKENADFANERAELQESLHSLRNQVRLLRSQRKREVVLANLPPVRHVEQRSRTASAAVDLCRRLQREVNCSPKAEGLVERLVREVQAQIEDRLVLQQRENILMDLLTGPPNSGGC